MGRSRRRNRRGRTDRRNSNSSRNNLDRDDDYLMRDVGNNYAPSFPHRRERGYNNNINNDRNNRGQQNRSERKPKIRNPFDIFTNPFEQLDLDGLTFLEEQPGSGSRGIGHRNRNRNRGGRHGNGDRNRHSNATSAINNNNNNNKNENNYIRNKNRHNSRNGNRPPRSSSPARRTRFCTECSTVRRANLTLHDWLSSAILHASEVLDSWSDEVGVGRGSADEMDWQPEPVVRVFILTARTATEDMAGDPTPAPLTIGGTSGQAQQQYGGGSIMGGTSPRGGNYAGALGENSNRNTGPWGLRPGALNPDFGGVWETDNWAPGSGYPGPSRTSNSWEDHRSPFSACQDIIIT